LFFKESINHHKRTQAQEQRAQLLACIQSFALIADQATSNQFFRTVMKKLLELSAGDRTKNSMTSFISSGSMSSQE
jgi:hypothetical protein